MAPRPEGVKAAQGWDSAACPREPLFLNAHLPLYHQPHESNDLMPMMNKLGSTTVLCAALVLWCGTALAETGEPSPAKGSPSRTETRASRSQAALQTAKAQVSWMSLRSDHIFRWLRVARGHKDLPRSRCLDQKVSEAHAVERQGRQELAAIRAAVRKGGEGYAHHLARLKRFAVRSNRLMTAAHRCGQKVSHRQRLPTTYRVRMVEPKLPVVNQNVRRTSAGADRRPQAARTHR